MTLRFEPSLFFSRCVGAADEAHGSDGSFCYGLRWRPPKCFAGETPCRRGELLSLETLEVVSFGNLATIPGRIVSLCVLCDVTAVHSLVPYNWKESELICLCSQCKCTKTAINNDRCRITKQSNTNTIRLQCVQTLYVYVIWIYMSI